MTAPEELAHWLRQLAKGAQFDFERVGYEQCADLIDRLSAPQQVTEEMRAAAGDIGDGFDLTSEQVIQIYRALTAALSRKETT